MNEVARLQVPPLVVNAMNIPTDYNKLPTVIVLKSSFTGQEMLNGDG